MADPSVQSKIVEAFLRLSGKKAQVNRTKETSARGIVKSEPPPRRLFQKHHITTRWMNGRAIWTVAPRENASDLHICYFHGGAYVLGFSAFYWRFISRLVDRLHCTVIAPDYPLAPQYHVDDVFAMALPLYRELVASVGAANLTVMGDSAGGGLALALAQALRGEGIEQPAHLLLLSPWLDVTMTNPGIQEVDALDVVLGVQGLRDAGEMYAGETATTDYHVSPIYVSVKDLAPITLFIGTHDILVADCRKLRTQAEAEGVEIDYHEYEGMMHVWVLLPLPEADAAMDTIAARLTAIQSGQ